MIGVQLESCNNGHPVNHFPAALCVFSLLVPAVSAAGEIPGLPSNLPPVVERPLEFSFSNDFLGRGGSVDDFRTQQFIITSAFADKWIASLDHSILTLNDEDAPGRTDQLSLTVGYRLLDHGDAAGYARITGGLGVRSTGDFGGQKMQNGFHRLVRSSVEVMPYTDTSQTDATAWVDMHYYKLFGDAKDTREELSFGYWLRGSALVTSDSQSDTAIGVYAVAARKNVDAWLGLRQDWRSGYEEPVLIDTAQQEEDLAAVLGIRWGPIVFETVQQFDNKASYGQLRLIASEIGEGGYTGQPSRFALDAGIVVPDVHAGISGRYRIGDNWSWFAAAAFGEPQFEDDFSLYIRSTQVTAGIEWTRPIYNWAGLYASVGAGWRQEKLIGDEQRRGQRSDSVDSGVVVAGAGARLHSAELFGRLHLAIQVGLAAWAPLENARVELESESFRLLQPGVGLTLGMTLQGLPEP